MSLATTTFLPKKISSGPLGSKISPHKADTAQFGIPPKDSSSGISALKGKKSRAQYSFKAGLELAPIVREILQNFDDKAAGVLRASGWRMGAGDAAITEQSMLNF